MVGCLVAFGLAMAVAGLSFVLRPGSRAAETRERTFGVSVKDGKMDPRELRAGEGCRSTPALEADELVRLHLHGYDAESEAGGRETDAVALGAGLTGESGIEDRRSGGPGVLLVGPR